MPVLHRQPVWGQRADLVTTQSANVSSDVVAVMARGHPDQIARRDSGREQIPGGILRIGDHQINLVVSTTWPRWSRTILRPGCRTISPIKSSA